MTDPGFPGGGGEGANSRDAYGNLIVYSLFRVPSPGSANESVNADDWPVELAITAIGDSYLTSIQLIL